MKLTWKPPSQSQSNKYKIEYTREDTKLTGSIGETDNTVYYITDLYPGAKYGIKVGNY